MTNEELQTGNTLSGEIASLTEHLTLIDSDQWEITFKMKDPTGTLQTTYVLDSSLSTAEIASTKADIRTLIDARLVAKQAEFDAL